MRTPCPFLQGLSSWTRLLRKNRDISSILFFLRKKVSIRAEGQYSLRGVCSWRKITRFLLRSIKLQITRRNSCWEERRFVSKKKHFHNWNSRVGVNITFLKRSDEIFLFRCNVIFLLWMTRLLDSQRSDITWYLNGRILLFSSENNLFKVKILSVTVSCLLRDVKNNKMSWKRDVLWWRRQNHKRVILPVSVDSIVLVPAGSLSLQENKFNLEVIMKWLAQWIKDLKRLWKNHRSCSRKAFQGNKLLFPRIEG